MSIPTFSVNAIVEQLKKDPRFSMIPRGSARLESLRLDYQVRAPIAPAHFRIRAFVATHAHASHRTVETGRPSSTG